MLWLCARFEQLPLEVLGSRDDQPLAVTEGRRVLLANAAASAAGVAPGQSPSTAQSLCPELRCAARNVEAEHLRLQQLALWGYRFSPDICLHPPDSLLLEVSGCLRLFKGYSRLQRGFARGLQRRGAHFRLGLAHTPLAAQLLSAIGGHSEDQVDNSGQLDRCSVDAQLAALPLRLLPCDSKARQKLEAMGLHSLGELFALPSAALNKRFGPGFGQLLARIRGELPDPRPRFQPPDTFFSERQFNGGLTSKEQLRFPMAALLSDLEYYLRLKQWINRHLEWRFHYCDGQREQLHMPLSHRHFQRRSLLDLVLLKLERMELKGHVDSLALVCEQFEPLSGASDDLFAAPGLSTTEQASRYADVIDKLQARLGTDCCFTPAPADEHLPELAWQTRPPQLPPQNAASSEAIKKNNTALRPLWLLPQPQPLARRNGSLYWRGTLQLLQGPERIDSHWWQQRQVRDYYIARHEGGALYWLYRDCLQERWYVHGLFA